MGKVSYNAISGPEGLLAKRVPFEGNTMSADTFDAGVDGDNLAYRGRAYLSADDWKGKRFVYVVWSYSTPIAGITTDGDIVIPDTRHSVTTSRQQGLCRAWL